MGIGNSITLVGCLAGLMIAFPALLTFFNLLFLNLTQSAAQRLQVGLVMPFFIGVITSLVIGIPATILSSIGSVAQLIGVIMFLLLFAWGLLGMSALARLIGMRITRLNDRETNPFIETVTGGLVLSFTCAFPLVGWFVVLPVCLWIGTGVITLAAVRPMKAPESRMAQSGSPLDEIALP